MMLHFNSAYVLEGPRYVDSILVFLSSHLSLLFFFVRRAQNNFIVRSCALRYYRVDAWDLAEIQFLLGRESLKSCQVPSTPTPPPTNRSSILSRACYCAARGATLWHVLYWQPRSIYFLHCKCPGLKKKKSVSAELWISYKSLSSQLSRTPTSSDTHPQICSGPTWTSLSL